MKNQLPFNVEWKCRILQIFNIQYNLYCPNQFGSRLVRINDYLDDRIKKNKICYTCEFQKYRYSNTDIIHILLYILINAYFKPFPYKDLFLFVEAIMLST